MWYSLFSFFPIRNYAFLCYHKIIVFEEVMVEVQKINLLKVKAFEEEYIKII